MPKTYSSIWLHAVWSTRLRKPLLKKSFRYQLCRHIKTYGANNGILIDTVNGMENHLHSLFRLRPIDSPSEIMRKIKGESSHWINEKGFTKERFRWQEGYGIFSVSNKDIERVREYIYNQQNHHVTMDYALEIKKLAQKQKITTP